MKIFLALLALCGAASAQFNHPVYSNNNNVFRPFNQYNQIGGRTPVDATLGDSSYHFSWRHAGFHTKWDFQGANRYCESLAFTQGRRWHGVSINSATENYLIQRAIDQARVPYIWTGGFHNGVTWQWPEGNYLTFQGWSHTGGAGRPQPDNREGNEIGLAVLNRFYNDGITWHDIALHHQKPIICETH